MATWTERVTTANSLGSHPASSYQTVFSNRFHSVVRTRGRVPAGCGHPSRAPLVQADASHSKGNTHSLHCFNRLSASVSACSIASPLRFAPLGFTTITKSNSLIIFDGSFDRASFQRRFSVFLLAMLPAVFATTTATFPVPAIHLIRKSGASIVAPVLNRRSKSALRVSLSALGGKPRSTLSAPSLQDVLTVLALHSYAEAVGFLAVAFIWLIGPLHSWPRMVGEDYTFGRVSWGAYLSCPPPCPD